MSSILYILRKSLKNALLELLHHPGKLVLYLLVGGMLIFSGMSTLFADNEDAQRVLLDLRILEGVYLGILLLVSIPTLLMGMNSGTTFFSMSDVSQLFVAPISSKKILAYGLVKQAGTTLLVAFFLLAYGGMAMRMFGIPMWQALTLLAGFAVTVLVLQIITMTIYSYVNGNERRIKGVKTLLYLLLGAVAVFVGFQIYSQGFSSESIFSAVSSPVLEFVPFAGWMKGLLFAVFQGDVLRVVLFAALLLVGTGVCLLLFLRSDADYYEDVLQNTESTYAMRQAVKEGRITARRVNNRSPKVKSTGLGRGWGGSAFFFKHMREIRRHSPLAFVGGSTLLLLACCLFLGILMQRSDEPISANVIMAAVLGASVYILFFLNAAGEWSKEIMKPYLYLVPENPMKKLIWASLTSLVKPAIEGAIVFTVVGIVVGAPVLAIVVCILVYSSFGFLFTSSNILSQRLMGQMVNKGLILFLYCLIVLLLVLPGLIVGLVLYLALHTPGPVMGIPVFIWNFAVSLGIFAICQRLLHDMEVN